MLGPSARSFAILVVFALMITGLPLAGGLPAEQQESGAALAIVGGSLIDGTGAPALHTAVIVTRDDRIICVGVAPDCAPPPDAELIDATGKWLIPGLVDTHIHLTRRPPPEGQDPLQALAPRLKGLLYDGITAAREMSGGGVERRNLRLRAAIESGAILGPGLYLSVAAGPPNFERLQASDLRDLVRRLLEFGPDGIKLFSMSEEDALTVIDEVRQLSALPVYGHTAGRWVPGEALANFPLAAIRGGAAGIVHIESNAPVTDQLVLPPTSGDPRRDFAAGYLYQATSWLHAQEADEDELIAAMLERGAWLEPTLATIHFPIYPEQYADSPYDPLRPTPFWERWERQNSFGRNLDLDGDDMVRYRLAFERMKVFVRRFHEAGGLVVTGSDGRGFHDELGLLVEAGLSPMAALQAGTINGARALGWEDRIGTVEVGKLADVLILDGDPLEDIRNARQIWRVITAGRVLDRAALTPPSPGEPR